jgi:hypothetical protein
VHTFELQRRTAVGAALGRDGPDELHHRAALAAVDLTDAVIRSSHAGAALALSAALAFAQLLDAGEHRLEVLLDDLGILRDAQLLLVPAIGTTELLRAGTELQIGAAGIAGEEACAILRRRSGLRGRRRLGRRRRRGGRLLAHAKAPQLPGTGGGGGGGGGMLLASCGTWAAGAHCGMPALQTRSLICTVPLPISAASCC